MNRFVAVQPDTLLGRHAQSLGHSAVDANDPVLIVEDGHEVRDGIEGLFPFLLGLPHRLIGPFAASVMSVIAVLQKAASLPAEPSRATLCSCTASTRPSWVISVTSAVASRRPCRQF